MVRPYHVAQKLEHLFIKDNNGTNIFKVKFCLHFTQKYYAVGWYENFKIVMYAKPEVERVMAKGFGKRHLRLML